METLGIAGIGYWGKNLIRVFSEIADVKTCAHKGNKENEEWLKENFPSVSITTNYETILEDPEIDAVIIATPIGTHYDLTKQALCAGKHVFVEKPLASNAEQASELVALSEEKGAILFVGYIFCYHPTLQPVFDRVQNHSIKWARFSWQKLGEFGRDIYLDISTHPVALALKLFSTIPNTVDLIETHAVTSKTDIALIRMTFPNDGIFDILINRVSPHSKKSLQISFNQEFLVWNEDGLFEFRGGTFQQIYDSNNEPLLVEAKQFLSAISRNFDERTNANLGYQVNEIVEQLHEYDPLI